MTSMVSIGRARHRFRFDKRTVRDNTSPQYPGWQERTTRRGSIEPLSATTDAQLGQGDYVTLTYAVCVRTPRARDDRPRAGDRMSLAADTPYKFSGLGEHYDVLTVAEHPRRRNWLQITVVSLP